MNRPVRTRFAPSPTGYLHVGGARTALFNWLFARHFGGVFLLRIEDTDLERSTQASIEAIFAGMNWLGLDHDEGPFYQTDRFDRYKEVINQLLSQGNAYKCYCSKDRLQALREEQQQKKIKPRYDGHCRNLKITGEKQPFVIRFRNPTAGDVKFNDMIRGQIAINNAELDDLIIARNDGSPTYNLTVVVDDWDMQITHVIRGDDHINNTPRQINILSALGATLPQYAHVPMILGSDSKRLSKRHGAVGVMEYENQGILPEALLNYLVRLGWAHGNQEIFSREEMIKLFNLADVASSPAAFDPDKLLWLNQHYMKTLSPLIIAPLFKKFLPPHSLKFSSAASLEKLVTVQAERSKTLVEMAEISQYIFEDFEFYDEKAAKKHLKSEIYSALATVYNQFEKVNNWNEAALHAIILSVAEQQDLKLGKLAQPIRVAVTGNTVSPSIDVTLVLLGKEKVLKRLQKALHYIKK